MLFEGALGWRMTAIVVTGATAAAAVAAGLVAGARRRGAGAGAVDTAVSGATHEAS